jgi:hypothetical protein
MTNNNTNNTPAPDFSVRIEAKAIRLYAEYVGDAKAAHIEVETITPAEYKAGSCQSVATLQELCPVGIFVADRYEMIDEQGGWGDDDSAKSADFDGHAYWLLAGGEVEPLGFDNAAELLELLS